MIRRWVDAGMPAGRNRLGGFERWAHVVGGILDLHGFADWLGNAGEWRREADPEGADYRAFVEAWIELNQGARSKAKVLAQLAEERELFGSVLTGKDAASRVTRFTRRVLRAKLDAPVGAHVLRMVKSAGYSWYFFDELNKS